MGRATRTTSVGAAGLLLLATATPALAADPPRMSCHITPDNLLVCIPYDGDLDGFDTVALGGDDCDDADALVTPAATEVQFNGKDDDCNPATPDVPPAPAPAPAPAPEPADDGPGSLGSDAGAAAGDAPDPCAAVPVLVARADLVDVPFGCEAPQSVFRGTADGDLLADLVLSRGQAAAAIDRMLELAALAGLPSGADWFGDDDGTPHEGALNRLADFGILRGTVDGLAAPGKAVTGPQFASMLQRVLVHTGHAAAPTAFHSQALAELAPLGVSLRGGPLTRGDAATALQALLDHLLA